MVKLGRELGPEVGHLRHTPAAASGQRVVLPWMTGLGFHPLRVNVAIGFEAGQERVYRSLGNDEVGSVSQAAQNLEAVKASRPKRGENSQFERPLTELNLPLIAAIKREP